MQKLRYSITINAPVKKVWEAMLQEETYRQWTKAFSEGSYYIGSWDLGSKILFLGPDPTTGTDGGMVSKIAAYRPYEFVSIEHLGVVHDGVEDTTSEHATKWAHAFENYTFTEKEDMTILDIELDIPEENVDMFNDTWPNALQKLKEIAENDIK